MHLAAESIPVAEKRGAVNASIALKISLYNESTIFLVHLKENYIHNTSNIFWNVIQCSMAEAYRRFGGTYACIFRFEELKTSKQTSKQQAEQIHNHCYTAIYL
jgi:hypothetical protein